MAMEENDGAAAALEMVTFTIIIDDIVFPDGRTAMACLGGGGPQTAFGALLWLSKGERVGLASGVGEDFPDSCKDWLETAGVDTGGLVLWPSATLRAWQILEEDGKRTEVWRVPLGDEVWGMLRPAMNLLPPLYQKAKTYHAGVHPSGLDVGFLRELRNSGAEIVCVEVYTHAEQVVPRSELQALVSTGHIFSPNEREAASLVGPGPPLEMIERLSELGAEIVVLRRGHLGCIVHRSDTKETWDVPAFYTVIQEGGKSNGDMSRTELQKLSLQGMNVKDALDPTGCGNTFCGGFLVGWYRTRNLLTAALWGSVSASFMLEYEGIPPPRVSEWRPAAQLRLELLQPLAKQLAPCSNLESVGVCTGEGEEQARCSVVPPLFDPTAFEREADFKCFHESFSAPFYLGSNRLSSRYAPHKPSSFHEKGAATSSLRTRVAKISSEAPRRRSFVKDIAAHIVSSLDGSILLNPQFFHQLLYTFHIRSLRNDIPSLYRMCSGHVANVTGWRYFDSLEAGYRPAATHSHRLSERWEP